MTRSGAGNDSVRTLLDEWGVEPNRRFGQNFVVDPNTVRRIVELAGVEPGDPVVEIGPGTGSLTDALLRAGAAVTAVEIDHGLARLLRHRFPELRLVEADALEVDWSTLLAAAPRWSLVANLPYNVAATIVVDVLERASAVDHMLVMVQKEVGDRLCATPGSRGAGVPSVAVALAGRAKVVASVPATVFIPRPHVESVLVEVHRDPPAVESGPIQILALARRAFGQRRKMLRRSLAGVVTQETFDRAGVEPTARPEELDLASWDRLAVALGSTR